MGKALIVGLLGAFLIGCASNPIRTQYDSTLNREVAQVGGVVGYTTTPEEYARATQWVDHGRAIPGPTHNSALSIVVTTGALSRQYETLGTVEVDTMDIGLSTSDLQDALFRSKLSIAVQGHSPKLSTSQMDDRLKIKARQQYGNKADAVINVNYRTSYYGDVFASGLAVHFIEMPSPATPVAVVGPSLEDRLEELKDLREKNLITPEEYYEKRNQMLKEF